MSGIFLAIIELICIQLIATVLIFLVVVIYLLAEHSVDVVWSEL